MNEQFLEELRALREEVSLLRYVVENAVARVSKTKYTISEAAKRMGISVATIYRRIEDGTLKTSKEGGRRFIYEHDIREFEDHE